MNSKEHKEIYNLYQSIYQEQIDENLFSNVERLSDKYVRPTVGNLGAQKGRDKMGNLPILGDIGARQGRDKATGMYDKTKGQLKSGKIGGAINTARSALETLTRENYDTIKGHLIDEGFADTEEAAHSIMASMSEQWMDNIVEANARVLAPKGGVAGSVQVKQTTTRTPGFLGTGLGSKTKTTSTPVPGTWTRSTPGREKLGPRPFNASGSGSGGAEAEMRDRSGPTDAERSRFNAELTKKHTKKSPYDNYHQRTTGSTAPSPRGVNRRANAAGHSGLMPTRDGIRYTKPNRSDRGY